MRQSTAPSASTPVVSAASLAALLEGSSASRTTEVSTGATSTTADPSAGSGVLRRSPTRAGSRSVAGGDQHEHQMIRRFGVASDVEGASGETTASSRSGTQGDGCSKSEFEAMLERSLDFIVHRLEDRILVELERRGGRYWRSF